MKHILLLLLSLFLCATSGYSQEKKETELPLTRILFVLDGSQSMLAKWESGTKMQVARRLLSEMVDSLRMESHVEMALRVYGHQKPVPPQDCNDTRLEVPFAKNNAEKIKNVLESIRPRGTTPIAASLERSANDFPKYPESRNIIILITDGVESCDGDPCAVSLALQREGIILKPFVIGVGLNDDYRETFDCVGRYYDAANEDRFKEVLDVVVSQALNTTSVQVNLLDIKSRPIHTNVNMSFYNQITGDLLYNFIHTINYKGNPDTLRIDPVPTYKIVVHTIPPVEIEDVNIYAGQHTDIDIPAAQGGLLVKTKAPEYRDLHYIIRQKGKKETLNRQQVNVSTDYLLGFYEIEIMTIPRLHFDVEIKQSQTQTLQIPAPGLITFVASAYPVGAIYKKVGNELEWIQNLDDQQKIQTYPILPGNYVVISRPTNAKESVFTSEKNFTVKASTAEKVVLY